MYMEAAATPWMDRPRMRRFRTTFEALPDHLPVYDGGSLKDVLGKVELVGDLGKLGEREGQVSLRGA